MKCPECGDEEALLLLQKVLCVNTDCENYDDNWATEQGYITLDDENLLDLGFMTRTVSTSDFIMVEFQISSKIN